MPLAHCLVCVPVQVMFLPQRPVAAPGNTLLEQLIYPAVMPEEGSALDLQHLALLLQQVGLTELLQRVQEDWRLSQNWQGMKAAFHAACWGARALFDRGCFQGMAHVWWRQVEAHSQAAWRHACFSWEHMLNTRFAGRILMLSSLLHAACCEAVSLTAIQIKSCEETALL